MNLIEVEISFFQEEKGMLISVCKKNMNQKLIFGDLNK